MTIRPACAIAAAVVLVVAGSASAAYFHEAHRADALLLSERALKRFIVSTGAATVDLSAVDASAIVAAPAAIGLFEQDGGIRVPCDEDGPKSRACELDWEVKHLAKAKNAVSRKGSTLTLRSTAGRALTVRDWNKCAPRGECDGERFTYLGPLGSSRYLAVQIGYGHDSPSLVLFHATSGQVASVHYGSEPTFLNPTGTLLVNTEDLNEATSVLVTSLTADAPTLDLQCLGQRTAERSFGVTFKGWIADAAFDLVLVENGRGASSTAKIPVRFERSPGGAWTVYRSVDLESRGFECRQRGTRPAK
jgi:hypothetical protein